ncbi:hypothetical protein LOAG_01593 [Loa loa]|uniref:Uncharacterized protein n=1 Tax=Loa loa TaxID=7209 RepID=A0A1S0U8U2_LOALO|nr:hypothetical protein LOAG_01593 [Loa loa]EFO26885.1 hypothetical protein LOAG_01593 [Loa loa]
MGILLYQPFVSYDYASQKHISTVFRLRSRSSLQETPNSDQNFTWCELIFWRYFQLLPPITETVVVCRIQFRTKSHNYHSWQRSTSMLVLNWSVSTPDVWSIRLSSSRLSSLLQNFLDRNCAMLRQQFLS